MIMEIHDWCIQQNHSTVYNQLAHVYDDYDPPSKPNKNIFWGWLYTG